MSNVSFSRVVLIAAVGLVLVNCGCIKKVRQRHYLAEANSDFDAGRYDKAEPEYIKALQINGIDPVANRRLGILYFTEGKEVPAMQLLRTAAALTPNNGEVQIKLGYIYLSSFAYSRAAEAAKKALEILPGNEDALVLLAESARLANEIDDAKQSVAKMRQQDQDRTGYHLALGILDLKERNATEAESEFRQALAIDPKCSAAYGQLAPLLLYVHHDAKQAAQAFKTAMDLAPLRSQARLAYIQFELQTGATDEAKKVLDDLTQRAPDYVPALSLVAKIAYQQRKYDESAAALAKILGRDPYNYAALLQRGLVKRAQGDAAGAIADLKSAQRFYASDVQLQYELALAYLQHGDAALGRAGLNQVMVLAPKLEAPVLLLADLNLRDGNTGAAISSLTDWVNGPAPSVRAYELLARAYLTQKNSDKALDVFRRMKTAFPKDPEPDVQIGIMRLQQNQEDAARQAFESALAVSPAYAPAWEQLLDMDLRAKRYADAEARTQGLLKQYPKAATPWLFQAKIDVIQRRLQAAETDLLKAIDLEPTRRDAYFELAGIYVAENKAQQALDKLTTFAAKTNSVPAIMQIALIHERLKEYDAARAAYERLLALDPRNVSALNDLAYVLAERLGQLDRASEIAKQARDLAPDDPAVADTAGWILYKQGDYAGALPLIQGAADKSPGDAEVQYHLGMTHYMLGEYESARTAFLAALAPAAESLFKDDARRRLAVLDIDVRMATPAMRAELEQNVGQDGKDPVALSRLAAIEERDGAAGPAAEHFEAALKLSPRNAQIMADLARIYSGPLKNSARALELAKSAHEILPNDAAIAQTLGHLLYLTGDYERSLGLLRDSAPDLSQQPELLFDLAKDYYAVGRVPEADAALRGVLQSPAPFSRRDEATRFAAMLAAGKSPALAQAALADAQKILSADPNDISAAMVTGLAQEQQANYPQARDIYEKILSGARLFAPATRQLALLYAERLGDDQKAYDLTIRAREAFPDDPELAGALGILDYRKADYAGALHLFSDCLSKRPGDPEMIYYLGMTHYQLKQFDDSKKELQQALDLNLADQEADEARRTLEDLRGGFQGPSLSAQPIN